MNCTYDKCLGEMTEKQRRKALGEKQQPPEWTLKGCETVDDPAEKERLRKELEKKERRRQQNREAQIRFQAKKKAEKEAAKEMEKEKQEKPKMTFADVAEELKQLEEPDVDTSLERLAKLRELAEKEQVETTKTENTTTEIASVTTEEPTEIVSEEVDPASDQEAAVAKIVPAMDGTVTLALTTSEAESLFLFIKEELLTVVKRDDVDELDWLVDMCSIYNSLRKVLI